jgi:preprotein translocase subunit SecD
MFEFPKWKFGLVAALVLLAALYALPNVFPEQPAIRSLPIAGRWSTRLQGREGAEGGKLPISAWNVPTTASSRAADADLQLKGADVCTMSWATHGCAESHYRARAAKSPDDPGLDLQGGVHFLMEVDQQAARTSWKIVTSMISHDPAPRSPTVR